MRTERRPRDRAQIARLVHAATTGKDLDMHVRRAIAKKIESGELVTARIKWI